jgi:hypothetical protein
MRDIRDQGSRLRSASFDPTRRRGKQGAGDRSQKIRGREARDQSSEVGSQRMLL